MSASATSAPITTTPPVEEGMGRAALVGSAAGFVVVFAISMAMVLWSGGSLADAVGVGLFAGAWGGPGFGGLMAVTTHIARRERAAEVATLAPAIAPEPLRPAA